ncbi:MAG: hypothetical protein RIT03_1055 [Bacteroidota bacterium]|jgi:uncharacterized OsmC-like protein
MTSKITYLGQLRTESVHVQSGASILSDAPVDNQGQGAAFSPTDLVANALGSCMMTIMGIKARDLEIDLVGTTLEVTKVMQAEPRKIGAIQIQIYSSFQPNEKEQVLLERAAFTCPVFLSLHPEMDKSIVFHWGQTKQQ